MVIIHTNYCRFRMTYVIIYVNRALQCCSAEDGHRRREHFTCSFGEQFSQRYPGNNHQKVYYNIIKFKSSFIVMIKMARR